MVTDEDSTESILPRATQGQRSMLLSHSVRVACKIASVLIIARLVSPGDHGLYAMAASLTLLLTLFRDFGLGNAAVQATDLDEDDRTTLYGAHIALGAALCAATVALIPALVWFYDEPRLAPLAALMSVHFVFLGINAFPRVLLARNLDFAALNRLETSAVLLATCVMIAVGALGGGAYAFASFLLTFEGTLMLTAWRMCTWRPRGRREWSRLKPFLRTGTDLTIYHVVAHLAAQIDTLAIGRWFGPRVLGLYNRPAQFLLLPVQHIAAPLSQVLLSALARADHQSAEFRIQFQRTTSLILYLTLPFAACCIALPFETVRLVLGPNWHEAAPFLRWLGLGAIFAALGATIYPLAIALRRTRELIAIASVSLAATATAVLLARDSGAVGIAATVALTHGVLLLPRLWFITRASAVQLRDYAAAASGPLVIFVVFTISLLGANNFLAATTWLQRLSGSLALGAVSIGLVALIWPRFRGELHYVWSHRPGAREPKELS
jgi:PST family polysaccharide transporter